MSEPEGHAIYEFGEFRFDATRGLLFAKGEADPLEIPPKALEAVLYFLQRPGELLEKDRLIADLWPDLVVEEGSLTHLISVLRRSLGESRGENLYIATVHGRGYRFVADVVRVQEGTESVTEAPSQKPVVEEHSKPSRGPLRVALTTLVVLAVGALFAYGWRTQSPGRDRAVTSLAAAAQMSVRSIAVLPFNTLSSAPENEFFAMGLADAILHQLASLSEIVVISATSSFAFKGSNRDIRDIGRQLNARYVLEGSVQSEKDRLRVTAQLIDSTTGGHVWSLRFDRKADSVFAMQDEIAQEVARALGVSLDPAAAKRLAGQGTTNLDAYLAFAKGRTLLSSRKVANAELAIESLSKAIEIDPGYAAAYAALADAWIARTQLSYVVSDDVRKQATSTARPLVEKALALNPDLAEAYLVRAELQLDDGLTNAAEADYRHAIALNPNYGMALERYADHLSVWAPDRYDEALALSEQARRVDPLTPRNHHLKALLLIERGKIEDAEALFVQALGLAPDFYPSLMRLGSIRQYFTGEFAEAAKFAEQAITIDPQALWLRQELAAIYLDLGDAQSAKQSLEEVQTSEPGIWLAFLIHERQLQPAATIAFADPQHPDADNGYCNLLAYAARDQALTSGEFQKASDYIQGMLRKKADGTPAVYHFNQQQILTLAQLRLAMGDNNGARSLAGAVLEWSEREAANYRKDQWENERAGALALLGRNDEALTALERSFASGYRGQWWYTLEREPTFDRLRSEARFQALVTEARAHAVAQRENLQDMRRAGRVPDRSLLASARSPSRPE